MLRFAVADSLMPDGTGHTEFEIVEINIAPAVRQQFAHPKTVCCVEQNQRPSLHIKFDEEELELCQFEEIRDFLLPSALANELERISIESFVPHRVLGDSTHQVPDLSFGSFCPLNPVQPGFDRYRLNLIDSVGFQRGKIQALTQTTASLRR